MYWGYHEAPQLWCRCLVACTNTIAVMIAATQFNLMYTCCTVSFLVARQIRLSIVCPFSPSLDFVFQIRLM